MKNYQEPEIEITNFQAENILVASGVIPDNSFDEASGNWD